MTTAPVEARTPATTSAGTYASFEDLFTTRRYPAGESHIELKPTARHSAGTSLVIEAQTTGFEHLCHVITADQILRRNGHQARWFLPYFPFARHDRRNHAGDGFELGVALDMMRDLDIVVADPHSDVAGQLPHLPQDTSVTCFRRAKVFATTDAGPPTIVVPDAGAMKKAQGWAKGPTVQALKHREPLTGRLSGFEVLARDLDGAPCVIVDDICDGGGTFLGLAAALRAKRAGPLTLAVTHGLFTKGTTELRAAFDRIVTFAFAGQTDLAAGVDYLSYHDLYQQGAPR